MARFFLTCCLRRKLINFISICYMSFKDLSCWCTLGLYAMFSLWRCFDSRLRLLWLSFFLIVVLDPAASELYLFFNSVRLKTHKILLMIFWCLFRKSAFDFWAISKTQIRRFIETTFSSYLFIFGIGYVYILICGYNWYFFDSNFLIFWWGFMYSFVRTIIFSLFASISTQTIFFRLHDNFARLGYHFLDTAHRAIQIL